MFVTNIFFFYLFLVGCWVGARSTSLLRREIHFHLLLPINNTKEKLTTTTTTTTTTIAIAAHPIILQTPTPSQEEHTY